MDRSENANADTGIISTFVSPTSAFIRKSMRNSVSANAPWRIRTTGQPSLNEEGVARARDLAAHYRAATPGLTPKWFLRENVSPGWAQAPTIFLEDHRVIDLVTEAASKRFEYRSLGLAADGDIYLVSAPRDRSFETYMSDRAGLGRPDVLAVSGSKNNDAAKSLALAKRCLADANILGELVGRAKLAGSINLSPFQSSGDVWLLAREIARRSSVRVRIVGPPPKLCRLANNKLWFAELVSQLLGRTHLPQTYSAYNLTGAAVRIRMLSRRSEKVVVKTPSSAGSLGNIVFETSGSDNRSLRALRETLSDQLQLSGWRNDFPLLVSVWDREVLSSPSAQMWVPLPEEGAPILEGVFSQHVSGARGGFVGGAPTQLPAAVAGKFEREALLLGLTLQHMGYFGRLSLDSVLLQSDDGAYIIHWIEANARWGGVSIPLTIAQRINPNAYDEGLFIVQRMHEPAPRKSIDKIIQTAGVTSIDLCNGQTSGVIFLSPPETGQIAFAVIGEEERRAQRTAAAVSAACQN